ncbi:TPA: hypothetical protein N0F65_006975 [Lagenidium giganteum]|uniref:RNase H type-1 domain-containing protein n=1 Tax=Lagenidium giganteum TaxID=4803 RepID=A0AAV2ZD80_9STRA|nr:TPA: hypothetical protein N0F65_006975 [Lagenidium giganteum]
MGLSTACCVEAFPLHVVGDSAMIIRQHRLLRPPRAIHLRPYFQASQLSPAQTHSRWWRHHPRALNKMTDTAANLAMDIRRSHDNSRTGRALVQMHPIPDVALTHQRRFSVWFLMPP